MPRLGPVRFALARALGLVLACGVAGCAWPAPPPQGGTCTETTIPTATITVDGETGDWAGIPPRLERAPGTRETAGDYRLQKLYVAADRDRLYLRIDASEARPPAPDAGGPRDAGATSCGNGKCEPGESNTCPSDCGGSMELRVYVKTTGFRMGSVTVARGGGPSDPWSFRSEWNAGGDKPGPGPPGDAKVRSRPGEGLVAEVWVSRKDFGGLISLYPTWARCCEPGSGPVTEDEMGCVWARWAAGAGPPGDGEKRDASTPRDGSKPDAAPPPSWTQSFVPGGGNLYAIWGSSASDIWAVGGGSSGGAIFHYAGPAAGWSKVAAPQTADLFHVSGLGPKAVWAVGVGGGILRFDGTTWTVEQKDLAPKHLRGVWATSANDAWAVGDNGTVLRNTGGGWVDASNLAGTSSHLYAVWGTPSGAWGIVGDKTILRWNGSSWANVSAGLTETLYGLWGFTDSEVWAVGTNGALRRYNGTSWTSLSTGTKATLHAVWASSPGFGWAVGAGGTILHFDGQTVSAEPSGTTVTLDGVWGSSATDVWAVGEGGLILHRPLQP